MESLLRNLPNELNIEKMLRNNSVKKYIFVKKNPIYILKYPLFYYNYSKNNDKTSYQ